MAKEIKEKKEKKEKKDKKEKRAETEGVSKSKKEKKDKKKVTAELEDALMTGVEEATEVSLIQADNGDGDEEPRGALVPFAFPLSDDAKEVKKILKTVKKSAKTKTLRRGVKEVVKALRKSGPATSGSDSSSIVVIAADISPMDVISHIPVLCEDHNVPYIYIKSRAALGEASATKRPTSVVMIGKDRTSKKSKDVKDDDAKEFDEAYAELHKLVTKAAKTVRK
ncbi:L30e-like protein [Dothidotthia symphoricarpi CBS 119687]|uniref:L30e-like protein n=1 Tax=Dothidotthia symphoricarpi CBS 119687 TaxID=1392245 RepID=A0A6A6A4W1_9PLEO|nr:L30e-like protein [Dothidotthia symphoricarpi CBS 119687]KAF2126576.1 L30e-like protein [Dothidotthia symphoricarpi CBS 119687]